MTFYNLKLYFCDSVKLNHIKLGVLNTNGSLSLEKLWRRDKGHSELTLNGNSSVLKIRSNIKA